jgi:hypothetical protein
MAKTAVWYLSTRIWDGKELHAGSVGNMHNALQHLSGE